MPATVFQPLFPFLTIGTVGAQDVTFSVTRGQSFISGYRRKILPRQISAVMESSEQDFLLRYFILFYPESVMPMASALTGFSDVPWREEGSLPWPLSRWWCQKLGWVVTYSMAVARSFSGGTSSHLHTLHSNK